MPTHVVVLGAGFGGLELAARLSEDLGDAVEVTLLDRSDAFVFGFTKLDVMVGHRTLDDVSLHYAALDKPRVRFRQETVISIDPVTRHVVTDRSAYDADVLVVALGADLRPELTPGLVECGHEFYSPEGAAALRPVLEGFDGGRVVIGVLGGFFKCPPAPYEAAFLVHDLLTRRGVRERSSIEILTPMPKPIPISDQVSDAILAELAARDIGSSHATWVTGLDATTRTARLRDGTAVPFDLFLGVPVHAAPAVVVESGLTEEDGWIAVDPATLETRWPDVFAIGDVASAPVPRAGVVAEGEAGTVADVLLHRLAGAPAPAPFAGQVRCYLEMGADRVGLVDVDFLTGPRPTAAFRPPTRENAALKRDFGVSRHRRWFGAAD